jgi:hypothetical protein
VRYKILDISFDLIENYPPKITNSIDYLSYFCPEQVLIEENINIYRHKERIELASVSVVKVWGLNHSISFLYSNNWYYY